MSSQFIKGEGSHATIADFSAVEGDKVRLVGFDHKDVQHAVEHAHVGSAGVTITLGDDTKITFANITDISKVNFS